MPRKYRPPAARRRKSKRPAPYFVEPSPQDGDVAAPAPDDTVATLERVEAAPKREALEREERSETRSRSGGAAARHIARDYSYVRAEVRRIVLVAGSLIIALIITALLRN